MSRNVGSRRVHWINGLLAAALLVGSAVVWPELPERVPGHFGAGGEVTRWDSSSLLSWFGPAILGLSLVAMLYAVAALLPGRPDLFNFPSKEKFLALAPPFRVPVIERMREVMYGLASIMLGLFALVQWTRFRTAHGAEPQAYVAVILVLAVATTPLLLAIWLPRIQAEIDRQGERERQLRRMEADSASDPQTDAP